MRKYLQKHDKIKYSNHWSTPKEIYNHFINDVGCYDPCPLYGDDFTFDLSYRGALFINPPYQRGLIDKWIDFAIEYHRKYNESLVTLLIPVRSDTKYFHKLLKYGIEIEFIKGRLKFGDAKTGAPFPSCLIYLKGYNL